MQFQPKTDSIRLMLKTLKDKFNQLGRKLSLNRLSDKNLTRLSRTAKVLAVLAGAHAAIYIGIGAIGLAAVGLKALGVGVPALFGTTALAAGALLTVKSIVFNRGFALLHKKCHNLLEKRGIAPKHAPEEKTKLASFFNFSKLKNIFSKSATPQPKAAPVSAVAPSAPKP